MVKARRTKAAGTPPTIKDANVQIMYDKLAFPSTYKDVEARLKNTFPGVVCKGKPYSLPWSRQRWIYLIYFVQFFFAMLLWKGDQVLKQMELDEEWLEYVRANRYMMIPAVMMLSPVRQLISSTGAFEIYLNDKLIHSTLTTKRQLTPQDVVELLKANGIVSRVD